MLLSLAAATVLDAGPLETIHVAMAAGYEAVGLRLNSHTDPAPLRAALAVAGLQLLDVEVIRLHPGDTGDRHLRLVDLALELGARSLLVVSHEPEPARTAERLRRLCEAVENQARVALEFMGFTSVRTIGDAVAVVRAVDHPAAAVLVDPLHLARTGGAPNDLAHVPSGLLPYVQVCDAASAEASGDAEACIAEARGGRLMPGEGALPLELLVDVLSRRNDVYALSVEVQSAELAARFSPLDRARRALEASSRLLRRCAWASPG